MYKQNQAVTGVISGSLSGDLKEVPPRNFKSLFTLLYGWRDVDCALGIAQRTDVNASPEGLMNEFWYVDR